ncbi:uncharacterized protein LOC128194650 [Vigna angularis]|uniref:uncharacterized protein LOC128194650 n=1 Tax=Phaseolus angularis TaxID=3914 RepID=UPI0022B41518|nr:uncharacterized protein LOC128194650 [Vigna angularis]
MVQWQQQPTPIEKTTTKLGETFRQFMKMSLSYCENIEVAFKSMKMHIGQLVNKIEGCERNAKSNLREECKTIVTRSGKVLDERKIERKEKENVSEEEEKEKQLEQFMEIFKKLEITIPFSEALQQMPSYAKFLKELLTKKRKYIEKGTIEVQGNCSAIIHKLLPPKLKDPGSFTIPCTIGELEIRRALIDLGASINLMSLAMFKRIEGLELKPTRMSLQLADRSLKYPYGVVEDVLVKTARVLIDVENGKLKVRVQDEKGDFDVFKAMTHPKDDKACFQFDMLDEVCMVQEKMVCCSSPLEKTLIDACEDLNDEEEKLIDVCMTELETLKEIPVEEANFEMIDTKEEVKEKKLELKMLPSHLKYVFLEEDGTKPVIISNSLLPKEEEKLVEILKANREAIGWSISNLKGISPT